jgi:hypothetical protein
MIAASHSQRHSTDAARAMRNIVRACSPNYMSSSYRVSLHAFQCRIIKHRSTAQARPQRAMSQPLPSLSLLVTKSNEARTGIHVSLSPHSARHRLQTQHIPANQTKSYLCVCLGASLRVNKCDLLADVCQC